jgi:hypothetical protein
MTLITKKPAQSPEEFWADYEKKTGEKVLCFALARCISGCSAYKEALWGLAIATDKSFIFHHFPQEGWLTLLSRAATGGPGPEEVVVKIPLQNVTSCRLEKDKGWFQRIFKTAPPRLIITYSDDAGLPSSIIVEITGKAEELAEAVEKSISRSGRSRFRVGPA